MKINIRGVDKADILAALYNGAHGGLAGGFSYLQREMTPQQAKLLIEKQTNLYFDYVDNRPLKIDLSGDVIDATLYDHYNGGCAAQRALSHLTLPSDQPVEEIKNKIPGKFLIIFLDLILEQWMDILLMPMEITYALCNTHIKHVELIDISLGIS